MAQTPVKNVPARKLRCRVGVSEDAIRKSELAAASAGRVKRQRTSARRMGRAREEHRKSGAREAGGEADASLRASRACRDRTAATLATNRT
jgi:hypothetical protein